MLYFGLGSFTILTYSKNFSLTKIFIYFLRLFYERVYLLKRLVALATDWVQSFALVDTVGLLHESDTLFKLLIWFILQILVDACGEVLLVPLLLNENHVLRAKWLYLICHITDFASVKFKILDFSLSLDIDNKCGSLTDFALNFNWTAHLFDDLFADREAQASSLTISLRVLIKLIEIYEQFLKALLGDADTSVDDADLDV